MKIYLVYEWYKKDFCRLVGLFTSKVLAKQHKIVLEHHIRPYPFSFTIEEHVVLDRLPKYH